MNSEDMKTQARLITDTCLRKELNNLANNYMAVYDEYHETFSRDSAFLKDAMDAIKGIEACFEVYVRDKKIHPNYAIEKLNFSKKMIESAINYYETVKEKN